jgi:hypothetical protein
MRRWWRGQSAGVFLILRCGGSALQGGAFRATCLRRSLGVKRPSLGRGSLPWAIGDDASDGGIFKERVGLLELPQNNLAASGQVF